VISWVFVMKKVHINMCPILGGYGVMGIFSYPYTPSCEPRLKEPAGGAMHSVSLVADFSQLQTVQFPLSQHLGGMRGRWGGLVLLRATLSSQPSGSLCCSWWWHFRKPALTLNLPTTTIVAQPFHVIKWQLKFNPVA